MHWRPLEPVVVCALCVVGCHAHPAENVLVGKSETAVRKQWGQPHHEFPGHYGAPPLSFTEKFTGEVKTSVFQVSGGEIYVSFEKQNGVWVVICNSWLKKGAAF